MENTTPARERGKRLATSMGLERGVSALSISIPPAKPRPGSTSVDESPREDFAFISDVESVDLEDTTLLGPGLGSVYIDPEDGTRIHWDYGQLSPGSSKAQCDQLCSLCQELARLIAARQISVMRDRGPRSFDDTDSKRIRHHETMLALRSSAESGCHLCSILIQAEISANSSNRDEYSLSIVDMGMELVLTLEQGHTLSLPVYRGFPGRSPPKTLSAPSTRDPKVLGLARKWLHICRTTHRSCSDFNTFGESEQSTGPLEGSNNFVPTRLIHIEATENSIWSVNLVISPVLRPGHGYTTLSHCWGNGDVPKLTEACLVAFKTKIPLEILPKSFLEAVQVTVAMGFQYLWIDSLCIIQDSEADWAKESEQMGKIYQNSELTLAAVKSHDSHGGLFTERSERSLTTCQLVGTHDNWGPIYVIPFGIGPTPLYTRGWVVQERCLSRRILEFGSNQIRWFCMQGTCSETEPNHITIPLTFQSLNSSVCSVLHQSSHEVPAEIMPIPSLAVLSVSSGHWIHRWWSILRIYSSCHLTFIKDRYPAIRGLANRIGEAKGVSMIHGLWYPYLLTELLWYSHAPARERLCNGSPSWSWLSTENMVCHQYYGNFSILPPVSLAEDSLAGVHLPKFKHAYGNTSMQTLMVDACMLPVARSAPVTQDTDDPHVHSITLYPFRLCDGRKANSMQEQWDGVWHPDLVEYLEPNLDLWAIQIIQDLRSRDGRTYRRSHGLVITAIDESKRVFKRAGFYNIIWDDEEGTFDDSGSPWWPSPFPVSQHWTVKEGKRWFGDRRKITLL